MAGYSFGPFTLDPGARLLLRDGQPIPMAGKTLDTLVMLVQYRGQLVDKDELLAHVWPGAVLEEANLSQSIFTVRKILGDSPKDHRYIATVAGRGYQFVAPVTELPANPPPAVPGGQMAAPLTASLVIVLSLVLWTTLLREPKRGELKLQQITTNSSEISISGAVISPDGKYLAYGAANILSAPDCDGGDPSHLQTRRIRQRRYLVSCGLVSGRYTHSRLFCATHF